MLLDRALLCLWWVRCFPKSLYLRLIVACALSSSCDVSSPALATVSPPPVSPPVPLPCEKLLPRLQTRKRLLLWLLQITRCGLLLVLCCCAALCTKRDMQKNSTLFRFTGGTALSRPAIYVYSLRCAALLRHYNTTSHRRSPTISSPVTSNTTSSSSSSDRCLFGNTTGITTCSQTNTSRSNTSLTACRSSSRTRYFESDSNCSCQVFHRGGHEELHDRSLKKYSTRSESDYDDDNSSSRLIGSSYDKTQTHDAVLRRKSSSSSNGVPYCHICDSFQHGNIRRPYNAGRDINGGRGYPCLIKRVSNSAPLSSSYACCTSRRDICHLLQQEQPQLQQQQQQPVLQHQQPVLQHLKALRMYRKCHMSAYPWSLGCIYPHIGSWGTNVGNSGGLRLSAACTSTGSEQEDFHLRKLRKQQQHKQQLQQLMSPSPHPLQEPPDRTQPKEQRQQQQRQRQHLPKRRGAQQQQQQQRQCHQRQQIYQQQIAHFECGAQLSSRDSSSKQQMTTRYSSSSQPSSLTCGTRSHLAHQSHASLGDVHSSSCLSKSPSSPLLSSSPSRVLSTSNYHSLASIFFPSFSLLVCSLISTSIIYVPSVLSSPPYHRRISPSLCFSHVPSSPCSILPPPSGVGTTTAAAASARRQPLAAALSVVQTLSAAPYSETVRLFCRALVEGRLLRLGTRWIPTAVAAGSSARCFLLTGQEADSKQPHSKNNEQYQQKDACTAAPHVAREFARTTGRGATRATAQAAPAAAPPAVQEGETEMLDQALISAQQRISLTKLLHTVPVYAVVDSEQQRLLPASFPSVATPDAAATAAAEGPVAPDDVAGAQGAAAAAEKRPMTVRQLRRLITSELQQLLRSSSCCTDVAAGGGIGLFFLHPEDAQQYLLHLERSLPRTSQSQRSERLQLACFSLGSVYPLLAHPLPANERRRLRAVIATASAANVKLLSFSGLISRTQKLFCLLNPFFLHLFSPILSVFGHRKSATATASAPSDSANVAAMRKGQRDHMSTRDFQEKREPERDEATVIEAAAIAAAATTASHFLKAEASSTRYVLLPDIAELEGVLEMRGATTAAFAGTPLFYIANSKSPESSYLSMSFSHRSNSNDSSSRKVYSAAANSYAFPASLNPLAVSTEQLSEEIAESGRRDRSKQVCMGNKARTMSDAETDVNTETSVQGKDGGDRSGRVKAATAATAKRRKAAATAAPSETDTDVTEGWHSPKKKEQTVKFFFFSSADALRALRAARAHRRILQQQQALLQQPKDSLWHFNWWSWGRGGRAGGSASSSSSIMHSKSRGSSANDEELQLRVTSLESLLEELADTAATGAAERLQQSGYLLSEPQHHHQQQQQWDRDLLSEIVLVPSRESFFCCQRLLQQTETRAQQIQEQQQHRGLLSSVTKFLMYRVLGMQPKQLQSSEQFQEEEDENEENTDFGDRPLMGPLAPGDIIPEDA